MEERDKRGFICYIDEAGCEGFKFDGGSSRWFILSAIVVKESKETEVLSVIKSVKDTIGKPIKKPLHWRDLRHDHKVFLASKLSELPINCFISVIDKQALLTKKGMNSITRLYFYSLTPLLKSIAKFAEKITVENDIEVTADIILSNRSSMTNEELLDYLHSIDENCTEVFGDIGMMSPGRRAGLQAADAVASATFNALEPNRFGFTEGRYLKIILPTIYNVDGNFVNYGIKITPQEAVAELEKLGFF